MSQYHLSHRHEDPEAARQAEHWLNKAAESGHEVAAYNLALAHIRGDLPSNVTPSASHVHGLLSYAVNQGFHQAMGLLHMCGHGQCFKHQRKKREMERKEREERMKTSAASNP